MRELAALSEIKTGKPNKLADAAAKRLRSGMRQVIEQHQVTGAVYGEASTFHLYLGDDVKDGSVGGLGAEQIRGIPKSTISAMQIGLRKRGVDLMSHMSGVTSMAHTEADVDETLQAFEDTVQEMIADGHIGGR